MIRPQEYRQMVEEGYTNKEIAAEKGMSYQVLRRRMMVMDAWIDTRKRLAPRFEEYRDLRRQGLTCNKIAEKMNVDPDTLHKARGRWGVHGDHAEDYEEE